jgi:hypothetical protein
LSLDVDCASMVQSVARLEADVSETARARRWALGWDELSAPSWAAESDAELGVVTALLWVCSRAQA